MTALLAPLADWVPLAVTVLAVAVVAAEWRALAAVIERHREGWVNVACGAASFLPVFALSAVATVAVMFAVYELRLFDLGADWPVWIAAYVAYDLASFLVHWASHRVRLLWCFHAVHHAPQEMKASVAFRGALGDVFVTPHTTLWLPLLGFHPYLVIAVEAVGLLYGVALHAHERVVPTAPTRPLHRWLITPTVHRLHHARNPPYLDTNYGLTFALWDRLLGTAQARVPGEVPEYGVRSEVDPASFVDSQTHDLKALWRDLRSARTLGVALGFLLRPPGWVPVGAPDGEPCPETR
ncbi:MAG: sterol desaturase family protein [Myxococcales bacterium]|nr:sterol desaturase family protein [Myxococcales bacterium]